MKKNNIRIARKSVQRKLLTLAVASCFAGEMAHANPFGPTVINGQVFFNTRGNLLQITNTPGSIINWQGFSISASEITKFIQQSASSMVLNRVTGADPSVILGALQSNGRVILINPNGVVFGAGSMVDTAGMVASTLKLSDTDFLSGRLNFTDTPGAGSVINQGNITTTNGGFVYLVAPNIQNSGIIRSDGGEIILAAGKSVEIVNPNSPDVRVQIVAPDNQAVNLGQIIAQSGRIGIYGGLVRQGGTVSANSAVMGENGKIVFKATKDVTLDAGSVTTANGVQGGSITIQSDTGTTLVSGTVEAKGDQGTGGQVQILGNFVGLTGNAILDASGQTGGGSVLIGGDYHGGNPNVQNAFRTYFGPDAIVRADAIQSGDGGKVIVWSDDITRAYGTISARGGAQSGNGGFVEVSSGNSLDFAAMVNTGAPNGKTGTLLLDPLDITITPATTTNDTQLNANVPTAGNPAGSIFFSDVNTTGSFTISEGAIETQTANIVLQAARDITVNTGLTGGGLTLTNLNQSLTMQAGRNVTIGSPVTTNHGNILLEADSVHAPTSANTDGRSASDGLGQLNIQVGGTVTSNGGHITLIGGGEPIQSGGGIRLNAIVDSGAGGTDVALSPWVFGANNFPNGAPLGVGSQGIITEIIGGTLDNFLKTTGTLTLGTAFTGGSDGLGTGAIKLTADSITQTVPGSAIGLNGTNGTSVSFVAGSGGVVIGQGLSTTQTTSITTTGTLTITAPVTTNGNILTINAASVTGAGNITNSILTGSSVDTWQGPASGSWLTAANWSLGTPTAGLIALINNTSDIVLLSGSTTAVAGLLVNKGTLTLSNSTLTIGNTTGLTYLSSTVSTNSGTINLFNSTLAAGGTGAGLGKLTQTAGLLTTVTGNTASTISAGLTLSGGALNVPIGTLTLSGTDTIAAPVTVTTPGVLSVTGATTINTGGSIGGTGTLNMSGTGAVTGAISAATLDYTGYTGNGGIVAVGLSGSNAGTATAISGGFTGVSTLAGNDGTATGTNTTLTGLAAGSIFTINAPNAGTVSANPAAGTFAFNHVGNLTGGAGADTFNVTGATGALSGAINGGTGANTLNYTGFTPAVAVGLATVSSGSATNVTGGFSNIQTLVGNDATTSTNTTLTGTSGSTYNLTGANSGNVNTAFSFSAVGNLTDSGAGNFKFTTNTAAVAGNISAVGGTLDYSAGITGPVTFSISNATNTTTGIGGTWSGITTAKGSASSDTITGNGAVYNNFNATTAGTFTAKQGANPAVSVVGFENINDAGAATVTMTAATAGAGLTGNVTTVGGAVTLGAGTNVGGNVNMTNAGTLNMGTSGAVTGTVNTATLSYASYTTPVTFGLNGTTTNTAGWTGVTAVTGGSASDTITGNGAVYNNFNATTAGTFTAKQGANPAVSVVGFENINDAGAATVTMTAATAGAGLTGNVTTVGGAVTLGAGTNVGGNVNMTNAGTLNMGTSGAVTGTVNTATLSYASYTTPVTFGLNGTTTNTAGWTGVTAVTGGSASDTITGNGAVYNNFNATTAGTFTAKQGANPAVSVVGFENINDAGAATVTMTAATAGAGLTGNVTTVGGAVTLGAGTNVGGNVNMTNAGTLNMGTSGAVTGTVNTATLSYASYTTPVTFGLNGTTTNTAGWTGVTAVTGGSASDTITGNGAVYNNFNATTAGTFTAKQGANPAVSVVGFENINDAGAATVTMTAATAGAGLTGNVTTVGGAVTLGAGTNVGGNVNMTNAGTLNMGTSGAVTGTVNTATLSYASYTTPVTFGLNGTTTNTAGWTGVTAVTGGSASDTITGNGAVYNNFNATTAGTFTAKQGANPAVSVVGFENINDAGAATVTMTAATAGAGLTGNVTTVGGAVTLGAGTNVGGNVNMTNAGTLNMGTSGAVTGTVNTATLSYASYTTPVTFGLNGTTTNTAGWTGVTAVTGGSASDTITGNGAVYNNFNATTAGTFTAKQGANPAVSVVGFENINDAGAATVTMTAATAGAGLTGNVTTVGGAVTLGAGTNVGGNVNMTNAGTLNMGTSGAVTGTVNTATLSYASYTTPVTFGLNGTTTNTAGWTGVTAVTGGSASDTITGNGAVYNNFNATTAGTFTAKQGANPAVSVVGFENINDAGAATVTMTAATAGAGLTGNVTTVGGAVTLGAGTNVGGNVNMTNAGTLNMGTSGAVTGTVNTATLSYASYTTPVTFGLNGTTTNTAGWTGVTAVTGGSASDTITGNGAVYNNFNATTAGTFTAKQGANPAVSVVGFENINDAGAATVTMTAATAGAGLTGNVTTVGGAVTLGAGTNVGGNVNMTNAGTLNMGTSGAVTGTVNTATLSYASYTTPVTINLQTAKATGIGGTFSGINNIVGNDAAASANTTLTGTNTGSTYNVLGANSGNVDGTIAFSGVGNLTGGTGTDRFVLATVGSLTGVVNGGTGALNMLDYSGFSGTVAVGLSSTLVPGAASGSATNVTGGFSNIGILTGNDATTTANTTLTGTSGSTYTLVGANTGNVNSAFGFSAVGNLKDGAAGVFNMGTAGSVSGNLTAVGGTINYASYATPVIFGLGGTGTGIGGTWSGIANVTGSAFSDTIASSGGQTFNLTGANAGNNGAVAWTSFENLTATGSNTIAGGVGSSLSGNLSSATSTVSGTITTVGTQSYTGPVTSGGLTLAAGASSITATNAANNISGAVTASGNTIQISNAGALTIALADAGSSTISAGGPLAVSGSVAGTLNTKTTGASGTTSFGSTIAGVLSAVSSGAISQTGALTVAGAASFDTSANTGIGTVTINAQSPSGTLAVGASQVRGDFTLNAGANAVTFAPTVDVAGNMTVNTAGLISAGANVRAAGTSNALNGASTITATGPTSFVLTQGLLNSVAGPAVTVDLSGASYTANAPVTASAINLGSANSFGGPLKVTTTSAGIVAGPTVNHDLIQTAPLDFGGRNVTIAAQPGTVFGGPNTLNGGSGSNVTLTQANANLGSIGFTNTFNSAITSTGPIKLASSLINGGLSVVSGGAVSQTGALSVAGNTSINAGINPIILNNAGNDFTGALTLIGGATTVTDVNSLNLASANISSGLFTAGTSLVINGNVTASAGDLVLNAGNSVAVNNAQASATGAVSVSGINGNSPFPSLSIDATNAPAALHAGTNLGVFASNVTLTGGAGLAEISGGPGTAFSILSNGNITLNGGAGGALIFGNPDVNLTIGGNLFVNNGIIQSASPASITIIFTNLPSGGFVPPAQTFFVGPSLANTTATLGTNLHLIFGNGAPVIITPTPGGGGSQITIDIPGVGTVNEIITSTGAPPSTNVGFSFTQNSTFVPSIPANVLNNFGLPTSLLNPDTTVGAAYSTIGIGSGSAGALLDVGTGLLVTLNPVDHIDAGAYTNVDTGQTVFIKSISTAEPGTYVNPNNNNVVVVKADARTGKNTATAGVTSKAAAKSATRSLKSLTACK